MKDSSRTQQLVYAKSVMLTARHARNPVRVKRATRILLKARQDAWSVNRDNSPMKISAIIANLDAWNAQVWAMEDVLHVASTNCWLLQAHAFVMIATIETVDRWCARNVTKTAPHALKQARAIPVMMDSVKEKGGKRTNAFLVTPQIQGATSANKKTHKSV